MMVKQEKMMGCARHSRAGVNIVLVMLGTIKVASVYVYDDEGESWRRQIHEPIKK